MSAVFLKFQGIHFIKCGISQIHETLWKCRCWFHRSGTGPEILHEQAPRRPAPHSEWWDSGTLGKGLCQEESQLLPLRHLVSSNGDKAKKKTRIQILYSSCWFTKIDCFTCPTHCAPMSHLILNPMKQVLLFPVYRWKNRFRVTIQNSHI